MAREPAVCRSEFFNQWPTHHTNAMLHKPRVEYTTFTAAASRQIPMAVVTRIAWRADSPAAAKIHCQALRGARSELRPKNGSIATEKIPSAANWKGRKLKTPNPSAHD